MKRLSLELNGKTHFLWAERIQGRLWVHFQGRTFSVPDQEVRKSKGGKLADSAHRGQVTAPMPGKITKVLARQGIRVRRGEALVVMEAMKMEYTLDAGGDATVEEVTCKTGDQVRLGQVLVRLNLAES